MLAENYVYAVSDIFEPSSALLFVSYHFDFFFFSWPSSLLTRSTMLEGLGPWPGAHLWYSATLSWGEAGRVDCVTLRIQFPSTVVDRCFLSISMYSHEYSCGLRIDHLVCNSILSYSRTCVRAKEMYAHSQSALIVSCVDQISLYPR